MTKPITPSSTLGEALKTPVGHDMAHLALTQAGIRLGWLKNPIVKAIKLKSLPKLSRGAVDQAFVELLVSMLNGAAEPPTPFEGEIRRAWWKEAVVYQIYPRSFADSNSDGIGDLAGITARLDYLQRLGVNVLWLSPVYDSPNDDNGYDIRDYRKIMKEFGTMQDFDDLLEQAHTRGMKLIMDLVINHTSDEHRWFEEAVRQPDSPYRDYYIFRPGEENTPPNNWTSLFSGPAWNYYPQVKAWALHLFSKKQMDLNWENPALRQSLYEMINWWLAKGIDGFRLDVISFISKNPGLPDGSDLLGKLAGFRGVEHYFHGPRLHEYLRELNENTFARYDVMTVGETPVMGMEMAKLLTDERRRELDTIFNFDHLENPGKARFDDYRYDLRYLKKQWTDWQLHYGKACWPTLFFENHDNPRMVSKVNPDPLFRVPIAKLLAVLQCTLRGTPFLYQGQELGMVNARFASIDEVRDVESINLYRELLAKGKTPAQALEVINAGTRDHARTPMQWDNSQYGGFSDTQPWLKVNDNTNEINTRSQEKDPDSPLCFFRQAIALRTRNPALIYGDFLPAKAGDSLFCYYRQHKDARFYIEINLTEGTQPRRHSVKGLTPVLSSYGEPAAQLRPYEAVVYRCSQE